MGLVIEALMVAALSAMTVMMMMVLVRALAGHTLTLSEGETCQRQKG